MLSRAVQGAVLAVLIALLSATPAWAVIEGETNTDPFAPGGDWEGMNWDYVYYTRGGSSVAIGSWHLVTADHYWLPDGSTFTVNIGGTDNEFEVESSYTPPNDPGQSLPPDMKIIQVKNNTNPGTSLPGYYQRYTGSFTAGQDVILVGTGYSGSDEGTYYTEDTGTSRIKRWGTNEYSSAARRIVDGSDLDSDPDWSTQCITLDFNSGDTDYEAGLGQGDSGGGMFVKDGGVWKLAGVNLYRDGVTNYTNASGASIPYYDTWIGNTIPEPGTLVLLGLGGLGLLLKRRRRTVKLQN